MDKEILKGSNQIIILSLLSNKNMYGYEIAKKIKKESNELYSIGEGTLYPALKRLEEQGLVHSFWEDTEKGKRRKYYGITTKGKTILDKKLSHWKIANGLIVQVTRGAIYE